MKLDVVGLGALNLDKLYRVNRIAGPSEETFVRSLTVSPGGSAANTIVGLSRLGLKTGYIGKLADDTEGEYLLQNLKQEHVDISGIRFLKNGRTGVCIGFIDGLGERALYIDPGVNDSLTFSDIQLSYAESSKFLHLSSFIGEIPFKTQKCLIRNLKEPIICLDPGELYARKGLNTLKPILKKTSIFLPNEKEMKIITKKNYKNGSKTFLKMGVKIIAVKLGERGCYVTNGKENHLIPAFKNIPKDTTGAGDAFCAGFIYGLFHNKDLYTCGKLGNYVASRCIRRYGARAGLPNKSDLPNV